MVAFLLMGVGGLLIILSILGLLAFLLEPIYRSFQIAIKQKDDYTHYLKPEAQVMLKKARKNLIVGLIGMTVCGSALFFTGYYMQFGERGSTMILSIDNEEDHGNDQILGTQAAGINTAGNFVANDGKEYFYYFIVRGNNIYYRDNHIGQIEDFEKSLGGLNKETEIYVVDGFAASKTYKDVMELLDSNGFKYRVDEE